MSIVIEEGVSYSNRNFIRWIAVLGVLRLYLLVANLHTMSIGTMSLALASLPATKGENLCEGTHERDIIICLEDPA